MIKALMTIHYWLWMWFEPWTEKTELHPAFHMTNKILDHVFGDPGRTFAYAVGSLIGQEVSNSMDRASGHPADSWVPSIWKFLLFFVIFTWMLDIIVMFISLFYHWIINFCVMWVIVKPMVLTGGWVVSKSRGDYGYINDMYLRKLWFEVEDRISGNGIHIARAIRHMETDAAVAGSEMILAYMRQGDSK